MVNIIEKWVDKSIELLFAYFFIFLFSLDGDEVVICKRQNKQCFPTVHYMFIHIKSSKSMFLLRIQTTHFFEDMLADVHNMWGEIFRKMRFASCGLFLPFFPLSQWRKKSSTYYDTDIDVEK